MSVHLTIGELERIRANEHADKRTGERPLDTLRSHLEMCPRCRSRLEELIKLDELAGQFRSVVSMTPEATDGSLRVPGYEVGREIHRGGQGIVFAAKQLSTGRDVAIKVLLHGSLASQKQQLRFEREIDLAARIQHPNVVSILDRGQTKDGRGYLAMELVDGPTLDGYIKQESLSIEERLRLFIEICSGVQAAHQRGVLHRDLKPGNILMDPTGSPKVLDFGLAKDDLEESVTMARTIAGEFMGTLAYASPEQLRGNPDMIDSRTDVYALGVLLYELITGELPHDMTGSINEVIRRVLEHSPKPPSSLVPKLDSDLDIVILHALEQDKERRYASVDAFSSDIEAVLANRPIDARRASTAYQIRKFARRHRVGLALASVVTLGAVGTITGLSVGIVRANAANQIAEQERHDAETELQKQFLVSTFFNELLAQVDPGQSGSDMRVTELLDVASVRVGDRFGEYPDLQGTLQHTLGETYTRLGSYEPAEAQILAAIRAFELQEPPAASQLAAALGVLAQIQTSTTRLDDATLTLDRAQQFAQSLDDSDSHTQLWAQLEHQRGALLYEQGSFEESIEAYERALSILDGHQTDSAKRVASQALIGLGVSFKRLERFDEALQTYERALILLKEVRSENHPDTLACLSNRAEILNDLGHIEEAEAQHFELLARRRAVFGPTHERVGITLNNLADLLRARGAFDEAGELFDEAIAIFRVNPGDPSLRLAITIHNAGVMHLEQSNLSVAQAMLEEAALMSKSLLPRGHWIAAQFSVKWAECLMLQGETQSAIDLLGPARSELIDSLGVDHRRVVHANDLLEQLKTQSE